MNEEKILSKLEEYSAALRKTKKTNLKRSSERSNFSTEVQTGTTSLVTFLVDI
jgi:hypothetical protein